jgi:alcohol dehydrogenase
VSIIIHHLSHVGRLFDIIFSNISHLSIINKSLIFYLYYRTNLQFHTFKQYKKSVPKFASFVDCNQKFSINYQPLPVLKEGEILVKNLCTSLCRSDIHTYQGKRDEKSPTILGHEIVGVIEQLGPQAPLRDVRGNELKIGDKLTWAIFASSPEDMLSIAGIPQKAKDLFKYGHEQITEHSHFHGGLSDYTILRKNTPLAILNNELPNEIASLINCSVATVAGAIRLAGELKGKTVLVYGAGMLGIIACAMASKMGAINIIAVDQNKERLEISKKFGATQTHTPKAASELKVDIVLEFSGAISAMEISIHLLHIGGAAIWVGAVFAQPPVQINAEYIIRNLITIKGLHNYNNEDFINAVSFMEMNHKDFEFEQLIKKGFVFEEVEAAFEYAVNHNPFRVSIDLT